MSVTSKTDAQKRADRIGHFKAELNQLETDRVLTLDAAQAAAVDGYHQQLLTQLTDAFDIDAGKREKQFSLGMKIASFLGALGLAASVFFLFYQFWGRFGTAAQVAILISAPLLGMAATLYAAQKERTGYFSKLAGLVTFACFVLNLSMFGQIFNIIPSDKAFLVWAAFAFVLAYAADARLLLAAGIISLTCFLSARMGTWSGCYWIHFGERPENFIPAAIILFMIPIFADHRRFSGFDVIFRVFALLIFFLPVLILSNWGSISYLDLPAGAVEALYQVIGFAVSGAAIFLGIKKSWPDVTNTGNVFFVIFLYTKFFDWWWNWMPKYLFFLVIGLTAILFLLVFKRMRNATIRTFGEVAS